MALNDSCKRDVTSDVAALAASAFVRMRGMAHFAQASVGTTTLSMMSPIQGLRSDKRKIAVA